MTIVSSFFAPAKVNLYLHVTARRVDGYHAIDSLFVFARDIGDQLEVQPAKTFQLEYTGPFASALMKVCPPEENLITRAAYQLAACVGRSPDFHMRLHKNLPLAAGLGGGSADAAACIQALLTQWQITPSDVPDFDAVLLSLGADVPACFAQRPLRAQGLGDEISLIKTDMPPLYAVLVNPLMPCPTTAIFKALDLQACHQAAQWPAQESDIFQDKDALIAFLQAQHNDLERPARALIPDIAVALDLLQEQTGCALARMSGSGASCFGVFDTAQQAQAAARSIQGAQKKWWVQPTIL